MKFYRVEYRTVRESSRGFEWFTSKQAADVAVATFNSENADDEPCCETEQLEIGTSRAELLSALNQYASHPDNG